MLLQAAPEMDYTMTGIMIVLAIVFIYFTSVRPQQKKNKEAKSFKEGIKKGQKVVTEGGIHGVIVKMDGETFILEVESGARLKMEVDQISIERTRIRYQS